MIKYLTEDITGACSGIEYGKAGNKVNVLGNLHEMVLVELGKHRFHVRASKLSDTAPKKEKVKETTSKETKPISALFMPKGEVKETKVKPEPKKAKKPVKKDPPKMF